MKTLFPGTPFNRVCILVAIAMGPVSSTCALSIATNSPMLTARYDHTATLLTDGRVLLAGGWNGTNLSSAELRDTSGKWTATGSMRTNRVNHTATLLYNGKVLVAGGYANEAPYYLSTAELYDPTTGTWTNTGSLNIPHVFHTATLLTNGSVLLTGGATTNAITPVAEVYDPATETWSLIQPMNSPRWYHTATLLPDSKVLVAGGDVVTSATAEIYDPSAGSWTLTHSMNTNRISHTSILLPNGQVLVSGGSASDPVQGLVSLSSAELYNPTNDIWSPTSNDLLVARANHSATLLPNGSVVVAGGFLNGPGELFSAEIFDPATNGWSLLTNQLTYARWGHTATLLPSGQTLFAGGVGASGDLASTEALDSDNVTASPTANMKFPVVDHTATLLTGGQVLVTGGSTTNLGVYASATMYTLSGAWIQSITVTTPKRYGHTATLLVDGNVLVAGGADSIFPSHPATNSAAICVFSGLSWTATGSMNTGRIRHTATLLLSGKVLVAGGDPGVAPAPCETYDPATGLWTQTGAMNIRRSRHTATLLPDGKVLVVGGYGTPLVESLYPISELYDPATGVWTTNTARSTYLSGHTATLLQSGKVLVVFGYEAARGGPTIDATAIYDPVTATWTATRGPNVARYNHTATLLPNGKVLIVGGSSDLYGDLSDAETYDPVAGIWTTVGSMTDPRARHTATLLPNGRVLIAGGEPGPVNTAELYDVGSGFSSAWQPHIFSFPFSVGLGSNFTTSGFYLRGFSEAAGGNTQNSASDHPVIQLLSIGSERTLFLSSTNWSGHHFNSRPLFNFPPGIAIATVFVNGIPGPAAALFRVALPVPTPPTLMTSTNPGNGSFHFTFTNSPGAVFGALATTNPALPLSNWTAISGVTEISPGQFQFTDSQSTNSKRFYRVRAL